jgi:hypothetical protein
MHQRHQRRQIITSAKPSISRNDWFENSLNQAITQIKSQNPDFFRTCDFAFVDSPPVDGVNDEINFSSSYMNQELGIQRIVFYKLPILSRVSRDTNLTQFLIGLIWAHKQ